MKRIKIMDEFSLIDIFFKSLTAPREDVIIGIGDDAACVRVPNDQHLVISCDTLVTETHFLSSWDAYDIAYKAVMVNVSDMAAMGAMPCWITLSLSLPQYDEEWLKRFASGLQYALAQYNISLIGGDTVRGPLSLTITIHGLVPQGKAVRRAGAKKGDIIFVSGELGAAALAVSFLKNDTVNQEDKSIVMDKLLHPNPRIDLIPLLHDLATAAIDISDGLSADLGHILEESRVGACLDLAAIPLHPLVRKYQGKTAIDFALSAGDDYELCFTVPPACQEDFLQRQKAVNAHCFPIGVIEGKPGLRARVEDKIRSLKIEGYRHF